MSKNNSWLIYLIALVAVVALIVAIIALGKISATGEAVNWKNKAIYMKKVININDCTDAILTIATNSGTISCVGNSVLAMDPIVHCPLLNTGSATYLYHPYLEYWGTGGPNLYFPQTMTYNCQTNDNGYYGVVAPTGIEGICCNITSI